MARTYHVAIAAAVANTDAKWVDNLLSHFAVPGVDSGGQGVARRLTADAIRTVTLVRSLADDFGLSVDRALTVATQLLDTRTVSSTSEWLEMRLDRRAFDHSVDARLAVAVESVVPRRRGRPAARSGRGGAGGRK